MVAETVSLNSLSSDMELSFVNRDEVMAINEQLLINIVTKLFSRKTHSAGSISPYFIQGCNWRSMATTVPDIREDKEDSNLLAFCWVVDFPSLRIQARVTTLMRKAKDITHTTLLSSY